MHGIKKDNRLWTRCGLVETLSSLETMTLLITDLSVEKRYKDFDMIGWRPRSVSFGGFVILQCPLKF